MEQLLHYVWKHRLFPLRELVTTDGRRVEVIDPGLHNHHAGPDFFNAKVKVDGTLWVGNVEIHDKSSDWYAHRHDSDAAYDNVVLHVATVIDAEVTTAAGQTVPQLQMDVPQAVRENYQTLLEEENYPPCYRIVPQLSRLTVHSWLSALQTERLEQKTRDIVRRVELCNMNWEDAYFVTLARNYGFGVNGDAFEQWAMGLPLRAADHHRDDLFQIEALFMGQAGLLSLDAVPEKCRGEAVMEGYFSKLSKEYKYLAHKFSLKDPLDHHRWKWLRMRPVNFPHIRIAQLANMYYEQRAGLSVLLQCSSLKQARELFRTKVTPYWETHYTFGGVSAQNDKNVSAFSINLILINTVVPMLFAYGRHKSNETLCDRAFDFLEQIRAEDNHIVRMWKRVGIEAKNAGDSQALIQLKNCYCDRKDCLRCRFGYEYLAGKKA